MRNETMTPTPDTLITTYLEMTTWEDFRPANIDDSKLEIVHMTESDVVYYRFLYSAVGAEWRWRDRLLMVESELKEILSAPSTAIYVLHYNGAPTGYIELAKQNVSTEIAYFGIRPEYIGRGLGKHLLSFGVKQAWDDGAQRVWVHTCNLDSPYALDNYRKRGFRVYDVREEPLPEHYF